MQYTKQELEAMSDYELSCRVLTCSNDVDIMQRTLQLPPSTCIGRDENNMMLLFDINNPSNMMPLVFEEGIELSPLFRGEWCASYISKYTYDEEPEYDYSMQSVHKNPLRSSAIVYILVKQGEQNE